MGDGVADSVVRRFGDVAFISCPLAAIVVPGCPTNAGGLSWVAEVRRAADALAVDMTLAEFAGRVTPVILDGLVAYVGERERADGWKPTRR
jgi:hypothetical protein